MLASSEVCVFEPGFLYHETNITLDPGKWYEIKVVRMQLGAAWIHVISDKSSFCLKKTLHIKEIVLTKMQIQLILINPNPVVHCQTFSNYCILLTADVYEKISRGQHTLAC